MHLASILQASLYIPSSAGRYQQAQRMLQGLSIHHLESVPQASLNVADGSDFTLQ